MKLIVFVCTGGTCRSPLAANLLLKTACQYNLQDISAKACALFVTPSTIHKDVLDILQQENVEVKVQGERLTEDIIDAATLVLCMETYHKDNLHQRYPQHKSKIFTLKEYIGEEGEIFDPFGCSRETYETVKFHLEDCIKKLIKLL